MSTYAKHSSTPIEPVIEAWLDPLSSNGTRRNYLRSLRAWRSYLAARHIEAATGRRPADLWDADSTLVRAWQQSLRDCELAPATVNHALACVSSFYEYALTHHRAPAGFTANPFRTNIRRDRVQVYTAAQTLTLDQYDRLLAHLESQSHTLTGARAHALIRTLLHTGWRAGELLTMRWGAVRPSRTEPRTMVCTVQRARGTDDDDVLPNDCYQAILHYLRLAGRPPETLAPDAFVWAPIRDPDLSGFGAATSPHRSICTKTALRVLRTWLRAAGIPNADSYRLLDLRHTHALLLLETGASVPAIQKRLGHAQQKTTERYLKHAFQAEPTDEHSKAFAALRRHD